MALDEGRFASLADSTLDRLMEGVEAGSGDVEVELDGGILTIELESGGQYVLNKHAPMRQLWLSSPVSGAWHFAYDEAAGYWRSTRGSETLGEILGRELGIALEA
jgi:frataxin